VATFRGIPGLEPPDALRLIVAGLIPAGAPAFALLSLPIALAVLLSMFTIGRFRRQALANYRASRRERR
jgi:hypothetical protein